jgi:hypothetical protein
VKLNVGGCLHYTTIGTLTKHDNMLRAMFSGRMEVLTDSEGWILIGNKLNEFPRTQSTFASQVMATVIGRAPKVVWQLERL